MRRIKRTMKNFAIILCAALPMFWARAQLVSSEAWHGAFWGGLIGGIVGGDTYRHHGHYHHTFSGEGAAIGAGVGLLAGAIVGEARRANSCSAPNYAYTSAPSVSFGYGYTACDTPAYVYYAPNAYCAPGWYYRPTRPNYALGGALLGAASGALIGAGSHDAGKGTAIGTAAGLVFGSVAESAAKSREQKLAAALQPPYVPAPPSSPQQMSQSTAQTVPQRNQITSRPAPDSTYYWTSRPQISNAPQVPDAPTF